MHLVALAFKAKTTLRLKEVAWLAIAVGGALLAAGAGSTNFRREGLFFGGIAICAGAVIAILALHYGK